MLPTLDARLTAAAELVLPGKPVADIGCDHGKLTAVLAASGKYPRVIGADLRPGPLAKAEQTLEHAGCKDRVELRLGDGLSVLSAGEVGTIVLAGVSAQTTWEIIEQAPWVSQVGGPRLVMVPATRHSELRRWLWEHGFALAGKTFQICYHLRRKCLICPIQKRSFGAIEHFNAQHRQRLGSPAEHERSRLQLPVSILPDRMVRLPAIADLRLPPFPCLQDMRIRQGLDKLIPSLRRNAIKQAH